MEHKIDLLPDVLFKISVKPEFIVSDEDLLDRFGDQETVEIIKNERAKGNIWSFCIVKVKGCYGRFSFSVRAGGCSFKNQTEFESDARLFSAMKETIMKEITPEIEKNRDIYGEIYFRLLCEQNADEIQDICDRFNVSGFVLSCDKSEKYSGLFKVIYYKSDEYSFYERFSTEYLKKHIEYVDPLTMKANTEIAQYMSKTFVE